MGIFSTSVHSQVERNRGELMTVPTKIQAYLEPQNVILSENRVLPSKIQQTEKGPHPLSKALVPVSPLCSACLPSLWARCGQAQAVPPS